MPDFSEQLRDGTIVPETNDTVVPQCILKEILMLKEQGISMRDIVQRLRPRTVPAGYVYHTWTPGMWYHLV